MKTLAVIVHGVDEHQPVVHAAFVHHFLHLGRDVHEPAAAGNVEPEFLAMRFQSSALQLTAAVLVLATQHFRPVHEPVGLFTIVRAVLPDDGRRGNGRCP